MHFSNLKNSGVMLALISALLFGASTPLSKYLLIEIDPLLLAGLLYLGSGIGIGIILIVKIILAKPNTIEKINYHDLKWLMLTTLMGGMIGPILLMQGLKLTNASTASLLLNMESILTAVIAWLILKEHTSLNQVLGMIFIVVGSVILASSSHFSGPNVIGMLLIIGACLAWGIDNNITRQISSSNPYIIVCFKSLVAGSTNTILSIFFAKKFLISMPMIFTTLSIGFLSYGVSLVCFVLALRNIGTARTSAYFSSAPFIGALLSVIFLAEALSFQLLFACLFMAIGVWIHFIEHHEHEHTHEELIHEHLHIHDEHHQHEHLPSDPQGEPHSHLHHHKPIKHKHPHYPDIHHRHKHT
jgi:drug/metabolite transporter (DMT)-like permease